MREVCSRLVDDPVYRESAPLAMEPLVWAYAHGKPVDRVETGRAGAFAALTDEELELRIAAAAASLK